MVLEAADRLGGTIETHKEGDFLFEAGPMGFLNRHPSTLRLAERVGIASEVVSGDEERRRRYILSRGKLRKFPDSPSALLTTDLIPKRALARLLLEPMMPHAAGVEEETVGAFARRRLGEEAAEVLVDPVITGIYAGDPERLSLQATVPHLAALEKKKKSLLLALLEERRAAQKKETAEKLGPKSYLSFRGGFGALVAAIAESLGDVIRTQSPVKSVARLERGFRVDVGGPRPGSFFADAVVSAAPATAARHYFHGLSHELDELLGAVRYAPVVTLALGYRRSEVSHPLDGFGYLVPNREGGSILGVLWATSIFPAQRSGPEDVLLQVIMGGSRDPSLINEREEVLIERARTQLASVLGAHGAPKLERLHRHWPGLPQYELGHRARLARAEAAIAAKLPGLFITGNAFRGVGLNACTTDAERVADAVEKHVVALPPWPIVTPDRAAG
jgi:protoporphyrinogen/coproporphyrinogen III oxidase